nr:thioesterase domain-containing protein [Frankia sp. Cppng1_Ct_nod]
MARLSGTEASLLADPEMRELILPVLRNDYRAIESYHHDPRAAGCAPVLSCPIVVIIDDSDPQTDVADTQAWCTHTTGRFELITFSGGHFFINDHTAAVTALVADRMATAASLKVPR